MDTVVTKVSQGIDTINNRIFYFAQQKTSNLDG